jgi:RNA polymerase sigma-70 factor, ECF subfamily
MSVQMIDGDDAGSQVGGRVAIAFDEFYARTSRRTLALAASLTRDWSAAEDLTQDAYVSAHRLWQVVSQYDDPASWVRRVVVNRAMSRWRRVGREVRALARASGREKDAITATEPIDASFWKAVHNLPAKQAKAITLRYVADLSVTDVAAALGCSEGAAKTHLHRARTTLHGVLSEHSPTEARP